MRTFEEAWAVMEAEGYQYGSDALENVRFGYEIAAAEARAEIERLKLAEIQRASCCNDNEQRAEHLEHELKAMRKRVLALQHALERADDRRYGERFRPRRIRDRIAERAWSLVGAAVERLASRRQ